MANIPKQKKRKQKTNQKREYTVEKLSFYKVSKKNSKSSSKIYNSNNIHNTDIDGKNNDASKSLKSVISNPSIPQFSLINFKKKTQSTTDSFKFSSTMYKFNLRKGNNEPLPNHVYSPTKFKLKNIKWKSIKANYSDMQGFFKSIVPFTAFGEDDAVLAIHRRKLELLTYNAMLQSKHNYLLFAICLWAAAHNYVMQSDRDSKAIEIVKNSNDLIHFEITEGINASYFSKDVNIKNLTPEQSFQYANKLINYTQAGTFAASKKDILYRMRLKYRRVTLIFSEKIINELNEYHYTVEGEKILNKWNIVFFYSLINSGVSFFDKLYFNPLIDAVKKNFHFSYFKTKVFEQVKLHPTVNSQVMFKSFDETDEFFSIHLRFNIKSIFIPSYNYQPFYELYNSLKHFNYNLYHNSYYLFNVLYHNYSNVNFSKRNYDKYGKLLSEKLPTETNSKDDEYYRYCFFRNRGMNLIHFKITIELMEKINQEIQTHIRSGKERFDPKRLYFILRFYLKTQRSALNYVQDCYQSFTLIDKIFYLYRLALGSVLDNLFPHTNYFYSMKFSFFYHGYNFEFCQSILDDLTLAYNEGSLNEVQYRSIYLTMIYLIRTASFFRYRNTIYRRSLDIIEPYPNTPEFQNNRTRSRMIPMSTFVNESQVRNFYNSNIKFENYPTRNKNVNNQFGEHNNGNTGLYRNRPNDPNNLVFYSNNFETNRNFDSNYNEVHHYLYETFYKYGKDVDISQLPIKYLKISKFGLLLNIDYRPDLNNFSGAPCDRSMAPRSFNSFTRISMDDELLIQYKIDREILLELSDDTYTIMKEYNCHMVPQCTQLSETEYKTEYEREFQGWID